MPYPFLPKSIHLIRYTLKTMATIETSFTSPCPSTRSTSDIYNQTIQNVTDLISGGSPPWATILKDPFEACLVVVQMLLCLTIYIGNSITLSAMSCDKTLKKNMQNKYIMSLAAADQVTGANLLQLLLKNYLLEEKPWLSCQPQLALLYMANAVGMLNMLSIAVDRYIYIVHPFVHMRHVTGRRISTLILAQWIVAALYGSIPIYVFNADESKGCNPFYLLQRRFIAFSHPVLFFVDCFGIGITYGLIAKVARQHCHRKNKRVQQINAVIVNNATKRKTSLDSSSTVTEIGNNVIYKDDPKFENTRQKYVHDADLLATSVTTMPSKIKEIILIVNKVSYGSAHCAGNNHTNASNINIDSNDTERLYRINNMLNENITIPTHVTENNCLTSSLNERQQNTADNRTEAIVFQTGNNVGLVVNINAAQRDTCQSGPARDKRQSLDGKSPALNNQGEIIISDRPVSETGCDRSSKTTSESSYNNLKGEHFLDTNDNTVTNNSRNNMQSKRCLDRSGNITTEGSGNSAEDENYLDTSNKTLTVNIDNVQSETYPDASTNGLTVNCNNMPDESNFGTNDTTATENSNKNKQVITPVGNHAQPPEEPLRRSSQQVNPWSLASLRWMKQMIVVFGLFCVCWTPSMVCIFISAVQEPDRNVVYVLGMFGIANSAVNVFVYSSCNKAYSTAVKRCFSRCCRLRSSGALSQS